MRRIVVVGGSLAGHRAAQTLRDLGYDGELTVVGAEPHLPYDRYPLSKAYLTGRTGRGDLDIAGTPPDTTWRVGETATGLDLAGRGVVVDDRTRLPLRRPGRRLRRTTAPPRAGREPARRVRAPHRR